MVANRALVPAGGDKAEKESAATAAHQAVSSPPRRKFLSAWLFVLGLASLSYFLGAAVMFFELPSSGFMTRAFVGARAWNERRQALAQPRNEELPQVTVGRIGQPEKAFD